MLNNKYILFLLPILIILSVKGFPASVADSITEQSVINKEVSDTLSNQYYIDYSDKFSLFLYAKKKYNSFSVESIKLGKILEYTPNAPLNVGFGFTYKWLGIGIAFNLNLINHDDDKYGKTKRMDWQTNIYTQKVVIDFYLQTYKGFYLSNTDEIIEEGSEEEYYKRPDAVSYSAGIGAMYVFNHKRFSYKSAFKQTAIQKKSAGSFLMGGDIFFQKIHADSSLFPHDIFPEISPESVNHQGLYFGILTAYAHNFIIKKQFFISLSLMASIHLGFTQTNHNGEEYTNEAIPVLHLQPRSSFGINRPKWYAGLSFVTDAYGEIVDEKEEDISYAFSSGHYRIFFGWRFNWFSEK